MKVFIFLSILLTLSRGVTVPREGLILRHDKFNLKLVRPLSRSVGSSTVSFLETHEDEITISKKQELGSGAFGTVWMCEIQIDSDGEVNDFVANAQIRMSKLDLGR